MDTPESLTDAELLEAYKRTTGEADDATTNALLAEIKRRELDV